MIESKYWMNINAKVRRTSMYRNEMICLLKSYRSKLSRVNILKVLSWIYYNEWRANGKSMEVLINIDANMYIPHRGMQFLLFPFLRNLRRV